MHVQFLAQQLATGWAHAFEVFDIGLQQGRH
jgi:hypothetical protein